MTLAELKEHRRRILIEFNRAKQHPGQLKEVSVHLYRAYLDLSEIIDAKPPQEGSGDE